MAYRSQFEQNKLSITVPSVQIDATGIDASPGRPVLDVSSPKGLASPIKQSLQQQQRKNHPAADVYQRRRRSCHGTLPEQQSPGWQLRQSWTLDTKQADGTSCSSTMPADNTNISTNRASTSSRQDAAGSSSKQDQQSQPAAGSAAAAAAAVPARVQQHQQAAAHADVKIQAVRPPSPFATPEVQACTCHTPNGKQSCAVHGALASNNMIYTGTSTTATTNSSSSSRSSKAKQVGQELRKVAKALWRACW